MPVPLTWSPSFPETVVVPPAVTLAPAEAPFVEAAPAPPKTIAAALPVPVAFVLAAPPVARNAVPEAPDVQSQIAWLVL